MLKDVFSMLCVKTLTTILFASITLLASDTVLGQTVPPRTVWMEVFVKINVNGQLVPRKTWVKGQGYFPFETKPWNNVNTTHYGIPIQNGVMPPYPLQPSQLDQATWHYSFGITAGNVDAFWDDVYKTSEGWVKVSPATTAYNCHGHSTMRSRFINDFDTILNMIMIHECMPDT